MTQSTNQPGAADLSKRTPEEIFAHHGQAPSAQLSFPSVWREELLSLPSAHVRTRKDALTPVRLLRYHSLRIPWAEPDRCQITYALPPQCKRESE